MAAQPIPYQTNHFELRPAADECRDGECDEAASGEREIRVDDGSMLVISRGKGSVEARPVHPQEDGPCTTHIV